MYAHVCDDGTRVRCPPTPEIVFADDTPIPLPVHGMFVFARRVPGDVHAAIIKGGNGLAYLIHRDRRVKLLGQTAGNYCVGLRLDGTPVWQDTATSFRVDGTPYPCRETSQGFLSLDAAGMPIWTDEQYRHPVVIHGQHLQLASTDRDWTVGQATDGTADFLAYHAPTDRLFRAGPTADSSIAPRITQQQDGSAILSRSVPDGWFMSSSFVPYVTPPPPTYLPPKPSRLCWRGFDGFKAPDSLETQKGNFAWGQPPDNRPILEGMPDAAGLIRPLLAVYISTEKNTAYASKGAETKVVIKEAARRGCAVAVYCDEPEWNAEAEFIADTVAANGRTVVRVAQAYLLLGESAESAASRVRTQVQKLEKVSQVGLMQRADCPPGISEDTLLEFTHYCEDIIEQHDAVTVQAIFGIRRPGASARAIAYLTGAIRNMPAGPPPPLAPVPPSTSFLEPFGSLFTMETKVGYLKYKGLYVGCDPHTKIAYADRAARGGWERLELRKQPDGSLHAWFVDAQGYVCVTPELAIEWRDAAGSWETLRGGTAKPGDVPRVFSDFGALFEVEWE